MISALMRRWLGILGVVLASVLPASAEVNFSTSVEPYELGIDIEKWQDINRAISKWGPTSHKRNATVYGQAESNFKWDYKVRREGNACSISDLKLNVNVKLRLPQWLSKYASTDGAQEVFECVSRTVTTHEKRHAQIWRETANQMHRTANEKLKRVSCHKFHDSAGALLRKTYSNGGRRQAAFDTADYKRPRYQKCWKIGRLATKTLQTAKASQRGSIDLADQAATESTPETESEIFGDVAKAPDETEASVSNVYVASFGIALVLACACLSWFLVHAIASNPEMEVAEFTGANADSVVESRTDKPAGNSKPAAQAQKKPKPFGTPAHRKPPAGQSRSFGQRS